MPHAERQRGYDALIKRHTEFWFYDDVGLKYGFAEPTGGHKPQAENEVGRDPFGYRYYLGFDLEADEAELSAVYLP